VRVLHRTGLTIRMSRAALRASLAIFQHVVGALAVGQVLDAIC